MYVDKDPDGFYWGECRGRRGYVPYNMVEEIKDPNQLSQLQGGQPGVAGRRGQVPNDRWGDIYASMPVKKMIALYDYDPQELSPNVDAEVRLRGNDSPLTRDQSRNSFNRSLLLERVSSIHELLSQMYVLSSAMQVQRLAFPFVSLTVQTFNF